MKKFWTFTILWIFLLTCITAGSIFSKDKEKDVPLSEIPQKVLDVAEKEMPGIHLTEAELVTRDNGEEFYELEGKLDGKTCELQITPEGILIKKELDDDQDNEDKTEDHEDSDEDE